MSNTTICKNEWKEEVQINDVKLILTQKIKPKPMEMKKWTEYNINNASVQMHLVRKCD